LGNENQEKKYSISVVKSSSSNQSADNTDNICRVLPGEDVKINWVILENEDVGNFRVVISDYAGFKQVLEIPSLQGSFIYPVPNIGKVGSVEVVLSRNEQEMATDIFKLEDPELVNSSI